MGGRPLKNPKKIDVIEKDQNLASILLKKFSNKINVITKDILTLPVEFYSGRKFLVLGNLPYNISTQIILNFISWSNEVEDMHFLVQKEVAEKIDGSLGTKNWGKLSIKLSAFFHTQILFDVPPESFDIKPKVDSSFIRLIPKTDVVDSSTKDKFEKDYLLQKLKINNFNMSMTAKMLKLDRVSLYRKVKSLKIKID